MLEVPTADERKKTRRVGYLPTTRQGQGTIVPERAMISRQAFCREASSSAFNGNGGQ